VAADMTTLFDVLSVVFHSVMLIKIDGISKCSHECMARRSS